MRKFRVYNRVRRVGVTWPVAGIELGMPSMILLLTVGGTLIALVTVAGQLAGPPLAIAVCVLGIIGVVVTIIAIARLLGMGRLSEGTQLRLVVAALRRRRYCNFDTPDVPQSRRRSAGPDVESVYRNF